MIAWDPTAARRLIAEAREDASAVRAAIEAGPEHVDAGEALADQLEAAIGEIERLTQERDDAWAAHETVSGWWTDAADRAARQRLEIESLRARLALEAAALEQACAAWPGSIDAVTARVVSAAQLLVASKWPAGSVERQPIEDALRGAVDVYRASKAGT